MVWIALRHSLSVLLTTLAFWCAYCIACKLSAHIIIRDGVDSRYIPLPQPCPSRPECSPVLRDSRYLPCEEKCVHVSEIFLPRGAFWQDGVISARKRSQRSRRRRRTIGQALRAGQMASAARAHLTHPTPTAFAFAFSFAEPLLPSPRRGGLAAATCARFKKSAIYDTKSDVTLGG